MVLFWFSFLILMTFSTLSAIPQTQIDSRYNEGKKQFEMIQKQAEMPKYGQCWRDAMTFIQFGCRQLTDEIQTRLALAYLNCFLEIQGRSTYLCSEDTEVKSCVHEMNDADRTSLTTFFTHTQNICYFLHAQIWQEDTENTINKLTFSSSQIADQLDSSHKLQENMILSQNKSLENQERLLHQAQDLHETIQSSSQNVRALFEDLMKSTKEQRQIIGNLFDQLAGLQSTILGEVSGFYSVVYYLLSLIVSYFLTSAPRISGARVWLFLIMTVGVILEQTLVRWVSSFSFIYMEQSNEDEKLYWLQKQCRRFSIFLSLLVLGRCAYLYKDINTSNNWLLEEIRKQNSDIKRFITGNPQAFAGGENSHVAARTAPESSDSDYTSDASHDEGSEAESDQTFIVPENQDLSDVGSSMTAEDVSESELQDLRQATPLRESFNSVETWLNSFRPQRGLGFEENMAGNTSLNRGSFYNLRLRKPGKSPDTSPATLVESPRSFSKTVHHLQQIAEKNSRLLRACRQQKLDHGPSHLPQPRFKPNE